MYLWRSFLFVLGLLWAICIPFNIKAQNAISISEKAFATNSSGLPILVRDNGRLLPGAISFTTRAYERAAFELLLSEANLVANELKLPGQFPITKTNLTRAFIVGYGMSLMPPKMIGNVHTLDYGYFVSVGHKLSYVEGAHQDEDCLKWMEQYRWPKSRMDSKGAYQLATQWLSAARMDVVGLNRDCQVHVAPDRFANGAAGLGDKFVPIYFVHWESAQNRADGYGNVASVKLFSPTKTLISLRVEDSKYILRTPLAFTNLSTLLAVTNVTKPIAATNQ